MFTLKAPRLARLAGILAASVGAGALGTLAAIYTYGLIISPGGSIDMLRLALWLAPGVIVRVMPIVLIGSGAVAMLWQSTYRSGVVVVAAVAGVMAGRIVTGHSPHVSPDLAAVCAGFAWSVTTAVALLVFDRRRGV